MQFTFIGALSAPGQYGVCWSGYTGDMETHWLVIPGGLGLFLFGMSVMTDGLRGLAGDMLHRTLARFTRSPLSGAVTGASVTALLQSSSATTVAAVGFVSAGLLTFAQALGIIFGANVGTTVTGWLVALLGLKFSIGSITLPLVFGGAMLRLLGSGRVRSSGTALAGFALIFLGISLLQDGMAGYQGTVTPESFPDDTLSGRLLLVLIGVAITLVTQSSSAGVATALTAVYTGTISFPQAAAMVIGMDVGTTVTAAIATLGGSSETRRTGYSHVSYNLMTGVGAFLLLTPYTQAWEHFAQGAIQQHAELALVGFHTLFNVIGVMLVLPVTSRFAALMYRLVPEADNPLEERLDRQLLREPKSALDAVAAVLAQQMEASLDVIAQMLKDPQQPQASTLATLREQLDSVHAYVDRVHLLPEQKLDWQRLNAAIHILDHMQRLLDRCEEEARRVQVLQHAAELRQAADTMRQVVEQLLAFSSQRNWHLSQQSSQQFYSVMDSQAEALRSAIMAEVATGEIDVPEGTARLEGVRWLRRVAAHIAKIHDYLHRLMPG